MRPFCCCTMCRPSATCSAAGEDGFIDLSNSAQAAKQARAHLHHQLSAQPPPAYIGPPVPAPSAWAFCCRMNWRTINCHRIGRPLHDRAIQGTRRRQRDRGRHRQRRSPRRGAFPLRSEDVEHRAGAARQRPVVEGDLLVGERVVQNVARALPSFVLRTFRSGGYNGVI